MDFLTHYITASRILNRLSVEKNRLWKILPVKFVVERQIRKHAMNISKGLLISKIQYLLGDFDDFPNSKIDNDTKGNILKWADQTIAHQFDYLGSGLVEVNPIDWHTDFISGFTWDKGKFYKKYIQVDNNNNADVKIPRELSRCHHLLWLGEAYLLTKDERYAQEIISQIENWIDENPLMYSINWCCSMDIAIRAVNWIFALNMIWSAESISDDFIKKFYRSLYEHGFFIFNNLEKGFPFSNNHYAADLTGLLYISQLFIETKEGQRWWNFSISEYFLEIQQQVLPSGVHFERSTSYHRLMVELFAYPYLMLKKIGYGVPIDIQYRIESMFDFISYYTKSNGLSPVIADNDDGRLLPFYKHDFRDHRYLLSLGAILFNNYKYKSISREYSIDCHFLLGNTGIDVYNAILVTDNQLESKVYKDAGFAILRNRSSYLFINNSGLSKYPELDKIITSKQKLGVHSHDDLLSFELSIGNRDIIIDAGAFTYTASPSKRNDYRATKKHNTVVIDNYNQNELCSSSVFVVGKYGKPSYLEYLPNKDTEELIGQYQINEIFSSTLNHKRYFYLHKWKEELMIKDSIELPGEHLASLYFHLSPELEVTTSGNSVTISNGETMRISMTFVYERNIEIRIIEDTVSPSYGVEFNSKTIEISSTFGSKFNFETSIQWVL